MVPPALGEGEMEALALGDSLGEAEGDTLGETLGEAEGELDALALGDSLGLAEGEAEGELEALALGDSLGLTLGDALGLALGELEGLALGEAEGLALLPGFSRMATPLPARSSEDAAVKPQARLPCPAVVSTTTPMTREPKSMDWTRVEFVPGASVLAAAVVLTDARPEFIPPTRSELLPGLLSVMLHSAQVLSPCEMAPPATYPSTSVAAVTVIATAYITFALLLRETTTALVPVGTELPSTQI
jgi:hypothetical protein